MPPPGRHQLRAVLYLYRGIHDPLIVALQEIARRHKASRVLELIRYGLQAEAIEQGYDADMLYGEVAKAGTAQGNLEIYLRINQSTEFELYQILSTAHNRAERLRSLANKGLRREARLQLKVVETPTIPRLPPEKTPSVTRRLMASMVASLKDGDGL